MNRIRLLVWLITLVALIAPPGMTSHAMASAGQASSVDCPDHAPPPVPCPNQGTAKHAAGACCPLMSGAVALLAMPAVIDAPLLVHGPARAQVHSLTGLVFSQDPPPPRV